MDVNLPDGTIIRGVPDGTTKEQLLGKLQLAKHPAAEGLMKQMASEQATNDTSGFGKFLAGAGKSVADVGLGIRQMTGFADQQEVDDAKTRDSGLMNTGAGLTGNITGSVMQALAPGLGFVGAGKAAGLPMLQAAGKLALTSPATIGGAVASGAAGGLQGLVQPTATGEDRTGNAAIGTAAGALIPGLGMGLRAAKGALEPLYQGGRDAIVGRALRSAAGNDADSVIQNLKNSAPLVPGSLPTAAEVSNSGGIAAMQRAASAVDPEAYAARAAQQNEARVSELQKLTGTASGREAAEQARDTTAGAFYKQARTEGINPEMAQVLQPQVQNLMERMPSGVMEKAKELARMNGETMGKDGSVQGLHYIKTAVDDLLSGAKQTGIGNQTQRALMQFKNDLLSVVDDLSPAYKQGRETFAALSKPINQMDVAQEIADKSINKLTGVMQPQAFARALSDDTAVKATGFNKATLPNIMEPGQLSSLNAIKEDLARSVAARDMGRGAGSDTVQKLAMTNLMQQAGLPVGLLNAPGLGRLGNWAYSQADDKMKQALAAGLLNPQQTAKLMEKATPNEKALLIGGLLRGTTAPAAIGGTMGLLNSRQ